MSMFLSITLLVSPAINADVQELRTS